MKIVMTREEFEKAQKMLFDFWEGIPDGFDLVSIEEEGRGYGDVELMIEPMKPLVSQITEETNDV